RGQGLRHRGGARDVGVGARGARAAGGARHRCGGEPRVVSSAREGRLRARRTVRCKVGLPSDARMKRKKPKPPPLDPIGLMAEGQLFAERGELAEAEARYRKAVAVAPDHLGAICLLALTLVDRENVDEAIDLLERARAVAPEFAPIQLALGTAYSAGGHD